ncbi:DUF732 domain-containing protein, partial [Acinetobacter baumannii]|uniref:DUF732 domain-containing protein n=1 Tax=Acinetobacter baumannii TaxID=470 RepID=UPI0012AACCAB
SSDAVGLGYAICGALNNVTGDIVARNLRGLNATLAPWQADATVVTAVEYLCPWHDHRDEL